MEVCERLHLTVIRLVFLRLALSVRLILLFLFNAVTLICIFRLSTIISSDQILVLQDGQIAERGRSVVCVCVCPVCVHLSS